MGTWSAADVTHLQSTSQFRPHIAAFYPDQTRRADHRSLAHGAGEATLSNGYPLPAGSTEQRQHAPYTLAATAESITCHPGAGHIEPHGAGLMPTAGSMEQNPYMHGQPAVATYTAGMRPVLELQKPQQQMRSPDELSQSCIRQQQNWQQQQQQQQLQERPSPDGLTAGSRGQHQRWQQQPQAARPVAGLSQDLEGFWRSPGEPSPSQGPAGVGADHTVRMVSSPHTGTGMPEVGLSPQQRASRGQMLEQSWTRTSQGLSRVPHPAGSHVPALKWDSAQHRPSHYDGMGLGATQSPFPISIDTARSMTFDGNDAETGPGGHSEQDPEPVSGWEQGHRTSQPSMRHVRQDQLTGDAPVHHGNGHSDGWLTIHAQPPQLVPHGTLRPGRIADPDVFSDKNAITTSPVSAMHCEFPAAAQQAHRQQQTAHGLEGNPHADWQRAGSWSGPPQHVARTISTLDPGHLLSASPLKSRAPSQRLHQASVDGSEAGLASDRRDQDETAQPESHQPDQQGSHGRMRAPQVSREQQDQELPYHYHEPCFTGDVDGIAIDEEADSASTFHGSHSHDRSSQERAQGLNGDEDADMGLPDAGSFTGSHDLASDASDEFMVYDYDLATGLTKGASLQQSGRISPQEAIGLEDIARNQAALQRSYAGSAASSASEHAGFSHSYSLASPKVQVDPASEAAMENVTPLLDLSREGLDSPVHHPAPPSPGIDRPVGCQVGRAARPAMTGSHSEPGLRERGMGSPSSAIMTSLESCPPDTGQKRKKSTSRVGASSFERAMLQPSQGQPAASQGEWGDGSPASAQSPTPHRSEDPLPEKGRPLGPTWAGQTASASASYMSPLQAGLTSGRHSEEWKLSDLSRKVPQSSLTHGTHLDSAARDRDAPAPVTAAYHLASGQLTPAQSSISVLQADPPAQSDAALGAVRLLGQGRAKDLERSPQASEGPPSSREPLHETGDSQQVKSGPLGAGLTAHDRGGDESSSATAPASPPPWDHSLSDQVRAILPVQPVLCS